MMNSIIENYTVEKETEKGLYVSIPYWMLDTKNKLIQKTLKIWIPKAMVIDHKFANWVIVNELKKKRYIDKTEQILRYFDQSIKPLI